MQIPRRQSFYRATLYASAVYAMALGLSVHVSVCPSQAGIVNQSINYKFIWRRTSRANQTSFVAMTRHYKW